MNDQRMWRLLLARLHPDAGGDHELFVFASAVKEEVCDKREPGRSIRRGESKPPESPAVSYLRLWQALMNPWIFR